MKKSILILLTTLSISASPASFAMDDVLVAKIETAMTGEHRSDKNIARNEYRNPLETLKFFGLKSNMTVLEMSPGSGWYTEILAPVLRDTGVYVAASYDINVPDQPEYRYRLHQGLLDNIENKPELYDQVEVVGYLAPQSRDLWSNDSVDMVLTFRSSHGWTNEGVVEDVYADMFKVLKAGGILGVVQHRAPETGDAAQWAKKGYMPQSKIVEIAKKAGFVLDKTSEVNANPKDLKDSETGVWRLPPSLTLKDQDREKYIAIGESDRMTLRFIKPARSTPPIK